MHKITKGAGVALTAAAVLACSAACKPLAANGDATPQRSHGTIVGPSPSGGHPRASIIPTPKVRPYASPSDQAETEKIKKEHPTVLCQDGYLGWPLTQKGACADHHGISQWFGVQNA